MQIHHTKHHNAYVTNLNKAIETLDEKLAARAGELETIFEKMSKFPDAIRNNAGGHYNHELFWSLLTPIKNTKPSGGLEKAIDETFGSLDALKEKINAAATSRFGSGWAWLSVDKNNKLVVSSTPNQDNPLMDVAETKGTPILGIDVWEHAYYLKYQNKRADYLTSIWNVINWNEVSANYKLATKSN